MNDYNPTAIAPYSQDAEEALIGAVLINPDTLDDARRIVRDPAAFFILRHQYIWEAMIALVDRGEVLDMLTIREELRTQGRLNDIGGAGYLTQLTLNVPTSVNAPVYAQIVDRAHIRRRLLTAADEMRGLAMNETQALDDVVEQVETKLLDITAPRRERHLTSAKTAVGTHFDNVLYRVDHPEEPFGIPTGFRDLDVMLGGLKRGELMIVAGRPGMGKSSLTLTMAMNAARLGLRIGYVTLEMSAEATINRALSIESGINGKTLLSSALDQNQLVRYIRATKAVADMPILFDDTPGLELKDFKANMTRIAALYGLDMIIVDYLQLMSANGFGTNRVQELDAVTKGLREMAKTLNVPVIAAAQLSRAVETRSDKRPMLSDLRESGAIENDSDIIVFLYRDSVYNEATEFPNMAELIVAKHRNGATGTVNVHFEKALTKFSDARTQTIDLSSL